MLLYFKKWYQSAQQIQGKRAQQFSLVNFYVLLVWRNELSIIIFEVQSTGLLLLQTPWILHGQNTVSIQFPSETKRTHIEIKIYIGMYIVMATLLIYIAPLRSIANSYNQHTVADANRCRLCWDYFMFSFLFRSKTGYHL